MNTKLDPRLAELVERAAAGAAAGDTPVDVLVGLAEPLDAAGRRDLEARGLRVRSDTGTVLTGSVALRDVVRLAESPHVKKLEASAPLYREPSYGEGG